MLYNAFHPRSLFNETAPMLMREPMQKTRRIFDRLECKDCIYKSSPYCWGQCPYNIWKKEQF